MSAVKNYFMLILTHVVSYVQAYIFIWHMLYHLSSWRLIDTQILCFHGKWTFVKPSKTWIFNPQGNRLFGRNYNTKHQQWISRIITRKGRELLTAMTLNNENYLSTGVPMIPIKYLTFQTSVPLRALTQNNSKQNLV